MNVPTLTMDTRTAADLYVEYSEALKGREPTPEDARIMLGYKALAAGQQILDLFAAFRGCGVTAEGLPKFAVGRAHWQWCHYAAWNGRAVFAHRRDYLDRQGPTGKVVIPSTALPAGAKGLRAWDSRRALVPLIPLPIRPQGDLSKYHILWEAEWQPVAPKDPLLLKHLDGPLYVILAMWDLTELERAVLAGRMATQPNA